MQVVNFEHDFKILPNSNDKHRQESVLKACRSLGALVNLMMTWSEQLRNVNDQEKIDNMHHDDKGFDWAEDLTMDAFEFFTLLL